MNIIYHIPWNVNRNCNSAGYVRYFNMLDAFKKLRCEVDLIMGESKDRYYQIKTIKQKIKNGKKYSFLYSESSTFPTVLTGTKIQTFQFPLLDFRFFAFCKKHKIPIGLFYRDVQWRFKDILALNNWFKRFILDYLHIFDLYEYQKHLDILYLPSIKMAKYLTFSFPNIKSLPPGCKDFFLSGSEENNKLDIIYVGGIGKLYKMHILLKVVSQLRNTTLTICCRKKDWDKNKKEYEPLFKSNIHVVHYSGDKLIGLYKKADIASIFLEKNSYREFTMPIKLFEYLGFHKPIIATKDSAVGEFVDKNDVGWAISYDEASLKQILYKILGNYDIIVQKQKNIKKILPKHTWVVRASRVCDDLTQKKH